MQEKIASLKAYFVQLALRNIALLAAAISVILVAWVGIPNSLEQSHRYARATVFSQEASGEFVVVELDAKSLQKVGEWPWRREIHADIIDKLSESGAAQIAFDVDFSTSSNPESDAQFANAISRASANIILATFRQESSVGSDRFLENVPLDIFSENAMLASVNVHPDAYGQVDLYNYGEITDNIARPSLAALISGQSGDLAQHFRIDQSFAPDSVPKISAIDVLNGDFDSSKISGRTAIIGATAIELGDHYSVPVHGMLPGVVIHSLAAETIASGRNLERIGGLMALALIAIISIICGKLWRQNKWTDTAIFYFTPTLLIALISADYAGYALGLFEIELGLAVSFLLAHIIAAVIVHNINKRYKENESDADTGLSNMKGMIRYCSRNNPENIAVLQIANFAEMGSLCSQEDMKLMTLDVARRLELTSQQQRIFRISSNQLAWTIPGEHEKRLEDYFKSVSALFIAPFDMGGRRMKIQTNCGYRKAEGQDWFRQLSDASFAAQNAKEMGYQWTAFGEDINAVADEKLTILSDIDDAIAHNQIWVAYQPKLDIKSGAVNSAEALARWTHPVQGNITPDRFIPLLEREGRMYDLTMHILRKGLSDLESWNRRGHAINLSVNISLELVNDSKFVAELIRLVDQSAIQNNQIMLEITETGAVDNLEEVGTILSTLRDNGMQISIDDYGTGQSTLSYLRGFPADEIKIDQVFVKSMMQNEVDRIMIGSTIRLAQQMDLKVVAEGVEDTDVLNALNDLNCDVAQGWAIGRPVDAAEFSRAWFAGDGALKTAKAS